MIAGEILRTVVNYVVPGGSIGQNVFIHEYQGAGAPDLDIVNSINAWLINDWHPAWSPVASQNAEIDNFNCDVLTVAGTVARNLGGLGINLPGGIPGPIGSAAASAYLLGYTDQPKQRGSKYVPGIAQGQYTNNLFVPGALVNLAFLLGVYLDPINVGGSPDLISGLLSRTLLQFIELNGNGLIDTQPAYQRRRKEGVGI